MSPLHVGGIPVEIVRVVFVILSRVLRSGENLHSCAPTDSSVKIEGLLGEEVYVVAIFHRGAVMIPGSDHIWRKSAGRSIGQNGNRIYQTVTLLCIARNHAGQ